jgi:hypothetical protein
MRPVLCRAFVFFSHLRLRCIDAAEGGEAVMAQSGLDAAFARLCQAARSAGLPGIEEGTSYGAPALRVQKKYLASVKDAETLVIHCALEEKEMLKEAAPEIYWETDHYRGWPAILVRLSAISEEELRHRLERAWRMRAGKRLVSSFDAMK